ncbi:riboflavin synthase [Candidatus Hoaglandella endobia]|uniref:Riboflavin synthase n=1 Tax=Candidatus Hoaglandella endobia TaxID=1778263 RepID=A0A143WTK8_9ENTR|nr:riboflavin synthase [Candidatus Hoaglandella endobia]CUX97169.1 Riboflavin synthase [Candidatus Hoaglandella endobia]
MFTGIIQATVPLVAIEEKSNFRTHFIPLLPGLTIGASVAHNGCCLTVTRIENDMVSFDLMEETLRLTNLSVLKVGDEINLERAVSLHTEIGGHLMSGHIFCTAELAKIVSSENNRQIWFTMPDRMMKYILYKGYIGVDGISLTVGQVVNNSFAVYLIPETLQRTTLGTKQLGEHVNIELDSQIHAIVDTVTSFCPAREQNTL